MLQRVHHRAVPVGPAVVVFGVRSCNSVASEVLAWTRPARWWGDLEPGWVDIWPPRRRTFEDQFRAFFVAIQSGAEPRADGTDGFRALEVVQAGYRSYAERRTVRLPLPSEHHWDPPTL